MVNSRMYILPTSSTPELHLRCRLYSTLWTKPCQVTMLTRCSGHSRTAQRFPVPESLFEEATVQPYIHNCFVTVHEGRHVYQFCIFFKRHLRLRANVLLSRDDHKFRGDAVVMRIGVNNTSVNMRGRDNALADFLIHQ
ncbi:hypothetical protein EV702DRAFT_978389 [Suillus placidus]|uniref:Uncharacterized protein n=1 Tax=Suillus placidus TaxID=48579 RepID=A0A9P6ZKD9_9AGAM|nr:hypothetical protein EV702DRAFT_978389 [Suillus placidus]